MRGGEYLNAEVLARLWSGLDELTRAEIARHPQGAGAWLKESHPLWRMVGRVTFHLAENRRHPTHPFAFMASYTSRISSQSRVQHLTLGRALQDYAGTVVFNNRYEIQCVTGGDAMRLPSPEDANACVSSRLGPAPWADRSRAGPGSWLPSAKWSRAESSQSHGLTSSSTSC